jgi:small subunit ribosomal protein S15e
MAQDNKRKIRKFTYRGKDLEEILSMPEQQQHELLPSRMRRKFRRIQDKRKYQKLIQKIVDSKQNLKPGDKPAIVKTHYRDCVIVPQMIGGLVGVYNGKEFKEVDIKFDMIGTYLGEYSLTYKPTLRKAAFVKEDKVKDKKK